MQHKQGCKQIPVPILEKPRKYFFVFNKITLFAIEFEMEIQ